MDQIENLVTVLIIVFVFISFIVNKKFNNYIFNKTLTFKMNKKTVNIKLKKITVNLLLIFIIIVIILMSITMIIGNLKYYFESDNHLDSLVVKTKEKIQKQSDDYVQIINKKYDIEKCKMPYIFDDFTYVEGTWDTGFVIQDENENQYVWVPCTNEENNDGIEILQKSNFSNSPFINKFYCNEEIYKEFLVSSLENGGFYISRFEIGKNENNEPVSKKDYEVWTNITREEAKELIYNMYEDINSELINGYAYDTAFSWIINNEEIELINKTDKKIYSGTKSYKNIYDIVDNICEITSEESYGEMIYRGIIFTNKYIENLELDNRLSGSENYKSEILGFRTILYK